MWGGWCGAGNSTSMRKSTGGDIKEEAQGTQQYLSPITVVLGQTPDKESLKGVPTFTGTGEKEEQQKDTQLAQQPETNQAALQASTLLSLVSAHSSWNAPAKMTKVWLGEGLGSIPKRLQERMLRWEFVDLAEFRQRSAAEKTASEENTDKLMVLPGFEVAHTKRKPVTDIITWVQCFSRYTAAMSQSYPECTPGFMSHMITVLKAYAEVEEPAWWEYDEAFREKMASTGNRSWKGMDVSLYQELCGSRPRRRVTVPTNELKNAGKAALGKRSGEVRKKAHVCWMFNEGECTYGARCKFPHVCEVCQGSHPKRHCNSRSGPKTPRSGQFGGGSG